MKQILTRVPDVLHQRAKDGARACGQSLNEFVITAIETKLQQERAPGSVFRARAAVLGLVVDDEQMTADDHAAAVTRWRSMVSALPAGTADAVLDQMLADRANETP